MTNDDTNDTLDVENLTVLGSGDNLGQENEYLSASKDIEVSRDTIYLVTRSRPHNPPHEYTAFDSREDALKYITGLGVDIDDLESYTDPGGEHQSANIPDSRENISIRELRLQNDE